MASILYALREQPPLQQGLVSEATVLQWPSHQRMETRFDNTFQDLGSRPPREDFILNRLTLSEQMCILLVFPCPDGC